MRSQPDTFVPAALEADVRKMLLEFNRRTNANADSSLVKRAHLEVRREIMRQRAKPKLSCLKLVTQHPAAANADDLYSLTNAL